MSNTNQRNLDGMEYNNNISIIKDCNGRGGSLEAEDTIFSDTFLSYTSDTPISLANTQFNQDGSVIITSSNPASSCSTTAASLIVNGGALINKDSVIKGILRICNTTNSYDNSTGSLIVSGGASIYKNLSLNGIFSIFNSTPSTSSSGSIITFGGITIQNSTNSSNISNGGALTVVGGASFLGDIYSNNFYGNQVIVTNGNFSNITSSNLSVSNGNIINISSNSLISTTITTSNLYSNNISSTNNSSINLIATYSTFANISVLNENITNLTVANLYNNNSFINSLNVTIGNIDVLTVGNLYVTNNIEYNDIVTNLSTSNIISDFSSIGSLQLTIGTFGSLHGILGSSFIYSDTISTGNLLSINIITTNTSTANLTASNAKINLASISNLQVTNSFITNFSSSYSIITNGTINNLYSSSGSINYFNSLKSTIGVLQITGTCPSISPTQAALVLWAGGLSINNTTDVTSLSSGGGLTDAGGASIAKSLIVGNTISTTVISAGSIYSNLNTNNFNVSIYSTSGTLYLTSTTPSYSSTCGTLVSAGGISIFNTTDVTSLTAGGGFTDAGGASIAKSLLVGGTIGASVISAASSIITNLNSINSTNQNAVLINTSISNLTVSSQTVNNLFVNNSTTSNANFGNITSNNLNSSSANISTLIFTNGSFGTLLGNYLSANYITNNISLVSQNATIQSLNSNNSSFGNVQITNGTFGGLIGGEFDAFTGSIGTLLSLNASIGNLYNTNNTTINQVSTNITTSSIIGTNANFIYSTIGTLFATNIVTNSLTIGSLNVMQSSIGNLNLNYETVGNSYIINLTNGNASITNSTIQNITNVYISSSSGSFINITSGTGIIINLYSTNGSFTNITSQNIYSNFFYTTNGTLINSTLNNTYITNSTVTNIYNNTFVSNYSTISNLYSSNGNITNITNVNLISSNGTFTNLLATNITNTNLISTNETITTLNATGATFGNINFTGTLYQNGLPYIASQWTSFGPNIVFTTGNVGINTTNPTSTLDIIGTGHFTQNVNIDGNISTSNIYASNISVGNINNAISISSQLLSSTNVFSTSLSSSNSILSNTTINNQLVNSSTMSNLNVSSVIANNIIIHSSIPSYNSTTGTLILENGGISINCTVNSISISSGGAATLAGGLAVLKDTYIGGDIHITGASYITGNTWLNSPLDLNQNVINNVTAPSLDLQVANKYYVDNRFNQFTIGNVSGNFTQGQVMIATTGGNITGFSNFTFDGITLTLNSTEDATSLTHGGALQVYGGASIDLSLFVGGNTHILGYLDMNNQTIMSLATPIFPYDAANKYYVDNRFSQFTIGNVSGNFTQGQVIVATTNGNITSFSDFLFDGTLLSLTSTNNALGLGSGGTLTVNGGSSFLGNVYFGSAINLNGQVINNVTAPNLDLQVANKYYVDHSISAANTINGNFSAGQIIIGGSTHGTLVGYPNFLFDGDLLTLSSTTNAVNLTTPGSFITYGGGVITGSLYVGDGINANNQNITDVSLPINPFDAVNKQYVDYFLGINNGDIYEKSVLLLNNVNSPIDIAGFSFNNTLVSSFEGFVYLQIPELNIYDQFEIRGLLKASIWEINTTFIGNHPNGIRFYITNTGTMGQVQYTNSNTSGTATLRFRATTTTQGTYTNITMANVIVRPVPNGGTGNSFFTQGTLLFGDGNNPINTNINLTYNNQLLYLGNTSLSTNLTSGGALQVAGGVNIVGNTFIGNGLDVNSQKITNVAICTNNYDAANKLYVDNKFGTTTGSLLISTITISSTENATNATTGGALTIFGGTGIAKDLYVGDNFYVQNINMTPSQGDIFYEQSFNAANNQLSPANITGFSFNNTQVRYFQALISVVITGSSTVIGGYEIKGIQLNSNWQLNISSIGQNTNFTFNITNSGQIQYTSKNTSGWISTLVKYRATTTSI